MKHATAMAAICSAPVSEKTKNRLRALAGSLEAIASLDHEQVSRVRHGLHSLKSRVRGPKAELIDAVLFVTNSVGPTKRFESTPDHVITDHAFCAGLRRYYGVDLNAAKDRMLEVSRSDDWVAVKSNQRIVTFYPKATNSQPPDRAELKDQ